jgi:hypothetical protein
VSVMQNYITYPEFYGLNSVLRGGVILAETAVFSFTELYASFTALPEAVLRSFTPVLRCGVELYALRPLLSGRKVKLGRCNYENID